jgi:hypothetical protein
MTINSPTRTIESIGSSERQQGLGDSGYIPRAPLSQSQTGPYRWLRALRVVTDAKGRRERRWCPMRKGVSNFWHNYQVGIAANRRYLDALEAAHPSKAKAWPHHPTDDQHETTTQSQRALLVP